MALETLQQSSNGVERSLRAVDDRARRVPSGVRVAYLLSRYPAISHTFFLQEVLGLRARGLHIETVSINPPDRPLSDLPPREADEARSTFYVRGNSSFRAVWTLVSIFLTQPAAVFRGLKAVCNIPNLTIRRRAYWLFYLAEALLLGRWMATQRLKHLHVHFAGPVASVGLLASAAWRIPFSLTIHGPEELLDVTSNHLREKIEQANFVICISDFCRSQLYPLVSPEHWGKLEVVRLGINPSAFPPPASPSLSRRETLRAVCIGRLVSAKGHRTLLEALLILREHAIPMQLTLIGDGPEMDRLQAFVQTHRLSECVTFTHALSHEKALAHLRGADLFVLASFAEGIPVALMEAMALSLPCVSTFVAGIPELIRDGVEGLLVPAGNIQALAEALLLLATDKPRRVSMGVAARKRVLDQYNLTSNHERLAEAFAQRLTGQGATRSHRNESLKTSGTARADPPIFDVSIIIVSYNTREVLRECILSVLKEVKDFAVEILVVDNASSDGSPEMIDAEFPEVHLLRSETNLGFGAANNLALAIGRGRYFVLLNSDAFFTSGALGRAIRHMDETPDCALGGSRLVGRDGSAQPSSRCFHSVLNDVLVLSGLASRYPKSRFFGRFDRTWADLEAPASVDWVPGAFCILRPEALRKVGLFDPAFFLYYEEVDLCLRLKRAGFSVWYWPDVTVVHLGGESSRGRTDLDFSPQASQVVLWRMRSTLLYYRKHHGWHVHLAWLGEQLLYKATVLRNRASSDPRRRARSKQYRSLLQSLDQAWLDTAGGRHSPQRPW